MFYTFIQMLNEMSPYLLLGFLVAGVLYAFVPASFYGRHLSHSGALAVIKAALIGVPLPLCSCGVLPTAVSLRRNGASKAATTSFLIATPQTGVDSIAATYSLLGPAFAIIRPVAALLTAIAGGLIAGKVERSGDQDVDTEIVDAIDLPPRTGFARRCVDALRYGFVDMVQNIGAWLIVGLVVATLITVFVPDDFFTFFASYPLLSMIAVVIVAVPMYICSTGSIPIALSLMLKGLSPGAAFVLLMAGPAANVASLMIVSRSLGKRAAWVYVGTIVVGAILVGVAIDTMMPASWFPAAQSAAGGTAHCCAPTWPLFPTICSAVLVVLLVYAMVRRYTPARHTHCHCHCSDHQQNNNNMAATTQIKIKGMSCAHCAAMVEKNLGKLPGVESVKVDLAAGTADIAGETDMAKVREVVSELGFEPLD